MARGAAELLPGMMALTVMYTTVSAASAPGSTVGVGGRRRHGALWGDKLQACQLACRVVLS